MKGTFLIKFKEEKMTNTFSSEIAVNEFLNCQNDKLQDTSYHLELRDSTVVVCNSDNSIASRIALLPTNPKEYICLNGTIESHIMGTCFIHGKWLEPVEITGCMKKIDDLYKIWGMHRFPLIERKEEHVIKVVFSALALHIEADKIYNFQAGWISDDELLIKNVLVSGDKIEYVENSAVKKGCR